MASDKFEGCTRIFKILTIFKETGNSVLYTTELQKLGKLPFNGPYFEQFMADLIDCISVMKDIVPFIKDLILNVPWHIMGTEIEAFYNFIMILVTTHSCVTYDVIEALFLKLRFDKQSYTMEELESDTPETVVQRRKSESIKICHLICAVFKDIPLAYEGLPQLVKRSRDFTHVPAVCQVMYLYNMLLLSELIPSSRTIFLYEIFNQINSLDLVIDNEQLEDCAESDDIFVMELDDAGSRPLPKNYRNSNPSVKSLDAMMTVMFRYIHSRMHGELNVDHLFEVTKTFSVNCCELGSICYGNKTQSTSQGCECKRQKQSEDNCKVLYFEMRTIFMEVILPTYLSAHIQYLMFYILAIRPSFIYDFIDLLKMNFESPNNSLELRRNSLAYIGSLLTRARFIPFKVMYSVLEIISKFCLSYIRRDYDMTLDLESLIHAPFYYAAQILFYVFTFRHKEFSSNTENLVYARALHLDLIVNSHMNPLKHCLSTIAINFAAVTCHFQLAYCYTVMERQNAFSLKIHNDKVVIDPLEFQPFEPYLLPRSASCVVNHFVEFEGLNEEIKLRPLITHEARKRCDSSSYNFLSYSSDDMDASF